MVTNLFINRFYLISILLIASFLLFYHLDNGYLWQDEAETGCLAKNVIKFGVPKVFDGKNMILSTDSSHNSADYMPDQLWKNQPWLSIYTASLSFRTFGISTLTARLPSAIFGLFSIFLTYLLAKRLFDSNAISNISIFLLTVSVPFLLHSRQCRYYQPGIFLTLLSIYFYLDYLEKKSFSGGLLLVSIFLLINTSITYYLTVVTGIAVHSFLINKRDFFCKRNVGLFLTILLYSLPILYFMQLSKRSSFDMHWILHNVRYYILSINSALFPWKFFGIAYLLIVIKNRRWKLSIDDKDRKSIFLISIFIISTFPYLIFVDFNSLRYVIHLVPLFCILEAYIFYRIMKRVKYAGLCLIVIAGFTNILNGSLPIQSYFSNYIYEITHEYNGPIGGIVKFLKMNAKSGDTVKIKYGDNACMFYTDMKIDNIRPFNKETFPEWVIPRHDWNGDDFYGTDYERKIEERYDKITIPYSDIPWENRPDDLGYHKFKTVTTAPYVTIYKRRDQGKRWNRGGK